MISGAVLLPTELTRVPKVVVPVTFGISGPEGPQLSSGSYFRVAKDTSVIKEKW